jgi:non-ribosomal peptide synthetase component F
VLRLVLNTDYVPFDVTHRIAQVSTFTFDAFTFELWGALLNGACLVGTGREVALSPSRLARFLADARIAALFLTSSLFHEIAQALPHAFARVRHLLVGGEAVRSGDGRPCPRYRWA